MATYFRSTKEADKFHQTAFFPSLFYFHHSAPCAAGHDEAASPLKAQLQKVS
jgi:hypothetical protein